MKIYIGADYRGLDLKNKIVEYLNNNYEVIDIFKDVVNDYTDVAFKVGEAVRDNNDSMGIVICGSGQGVCIAANKVKGIRCVRAATEEDAFFGRDHDLANVLALGSEVTPDFSLVCKIVDKFIMTPNSTIDRRLKRIEQIKRYEENN